jgi:GNAT superfamily N-acetyltransferase
MVKPKPRITAVNGLDPKIRHMLLWLQLSTLPADPLVESGVGYWWVAYEGCLPIAFLGVLPLESCPKTGYVSRVGVMPDFRGHGLQKRLLAVCERKAKAIGWEQLISSTYRNPPSANSFVARKYRTYEPQVRWGAEDTIYWIKRLQ